MTRVLVILLTLIMITFGSIVVGQESTAAEDTKDVFAQRSVWKTFPPPFLQALATAMGSPSRATEFAFFCEHTELLRSNIAGYNLAQPEEGLAETAITLTSYGYGMAKKGRYSEARQSWEFALLLAPRHVAAWIGMAVLSVNEQDCEGATFWADKVLGYRPDPNSDNPIEAVNADARRAVSWDGVTDQMREIKAMCRGG